MKRRMWERIVWISASMVLLLTVRQLADASKSRLVDGRDIGSRGDGDAAIAVVAMFDGDLLDSVTARVIAHDPFRLDRKPTNVAYTTTPVGIVAPIVAAAPAIHIVLQGTIGGPPWHAIISGVPGREGTIVVSAGDTLGGVAIRRVSRDGVTVRVKDSTWTVSMPKAGAE